MKYKKVLILCIILLGFSLTTKAVAMTSDVTTQTTFNDAKPGTVIPLKLENFEMQTDTPILADWKPTHVQWYLTGPSGTVAYKKSALTSIKQISGNDLGKAKWRINQDDGTWKIPAFAEPGTWKVKIKLIDKGLFDTGVLHGESQHNIHTIYVSEGSIFDSLMAPIHFYWNMGFIGEIGFSTPDIIIMIAGPILIIIVWINISAMRGKFRRQRMREDVEYAYAMREAMDYGDEEYY